MFAAISRIRDATRTVAIAMLMGMRVSLAVGERDVMIGLRVPWPFCKAVAGAECTEDSMVPP